MEGQRKVKVAVVFGGRGPEHAISCLGAGNVLRTIDRDRYDVIAIGITREGAWLEVSDEPDKLAITSGELPSVEAVAKPDAHVVPWAYQGDTAIVASAPGHIPHALGEVDVVLPVLHGPFGEDGTIQGLLELAGVPYVGAGVLASAVSMDKEYMKLIFAARGLPVGPHVVVRDRDWPASAEPTAAQLRVAGELETLGWPLFVKPARGGSSLGTTKAADQAELAEAIALARQFDPKVLVEAAVVAREIEVAVLQGLDGAPPDTSLPGELRLDGGEEFYDFEAKYLDASSGMLIPAPIPSADIERIRQLAATAFDAVSAEGLARIDFFYLPDGQIMINEINTFPGMSPTSYFQKMWEASGLAFPQVIDRLLATALARRPRPALAAQRRATWWPPAEGRAARDRLGAPACYLLPACGGLLLVAVHQGLEVGACPELRYRGLGNLDGRAGGWVPRGSGGPVGLFEDAESSDRYLVALGDRVLDGVEKCVNGLSCGLLVPQPARNRIDQVTLVHFLTPAGPPTGSPRARTFLTALAPRPLTCLKLGDATSPHNHLRNKRGVSLLKVGAIQ